MSRAPAPSAPLTPLALAPAMADALARWLEGGRSTRGRAAHTITAYQGDLLAFLSFLGGHHGEAALPRTLAALTQTDLRAFAAAERARGLSARSLARRMSAVRSFLRWLSDREGFDASRALSSRSPRYRRSLPRPIGPDQARAVSLAVARGEVSLALRSLSDGEGGPRLSAVDMPVRTEETDDRDRGRNTMTVYRYGQRQDVALGDGG